MMQFYEDGIALMSLWYPINDSEMKKKELTINLGYMINEFVKAGTYQQEGQTLDYLANVYISQTYNGYDLEQKLERPDFYEAFLSMQQEIGDFWERFFTNKELVT